MSKGKWKNRKCDCDDAGTCKYCKDRARHTKTWKEKMKGRIWKKDQRAAEVAWRKMVREEKKEKKLAE